MFTESLPSNKHLFSGFRAPCHNRFFLRRSDISRGGSLYVSEKRNHVNPFASLNRNRYLFEKECLHLTNMCFLAESLPLIFRDPFIRGRNLYLKLHNRVVNNPIIRRGMTHLSVNLSCDTVKLSSHEISLSAIHVIIPSVWQNLNWSLSLRAQMPQGHSTSRPVRWLTWTLINPHVWKAHLGCI
jgi:hypothetical protein